MSTLALTAGAAPLLAACLLTVLVRRRRTPSATLPAGLPSTPLPDYGPIPARPRAEKVLVRQPWPGAVPSQWSCR